MKAHTLAALALFVPSLAFAAEMDPEQLYELSTEGTTTTIQPGGKGTFVLEIRALNGAHVSDEAPLKVELSGQGISFEKKKLTLKDSVGKKAEGEAYPTPRFEVPLTASVQGKTQVDARLTFFICTDTLCARQQKTLSLPVEVL